MKETNFYVLLKIENMIKFVKCDKTFKDLQKLYSKLIYLQSSSKSIKWTIK